MKNSKERVLARGAAALVCLSLLALPSVALFAEDSVSPVPESNVNPRTGADHNEGGNEADTTLPSSPSSTTTSAAPAPTAAPTKPTTVPLPSSEPTETAPKPSETPSTAPPEIEPSVPDDLILHVGDIRIRYEKSKLPVFKDQEEGELVLTLQNFGRDVAENIVLTPILDERSEVWPFEIDSNDYSVELKELKPVSQVKRGETYKDAENKVRPYGQVSIKGLKVREGVRSGYLPIRFNITYFNKKSGIKNVIKDSRYFIRHEVTEVPTEPSVADGNGYDGGGGGGEPVKNNVARLLLTGFETDAQPVNAGHYFKLKLNFKNSSKDTLLQNIKITLSSENSAFLPKTGSSTLFLEKVEKEESVSQEIELLPLATLEQKPYPITINLEYEDKDHTELKSAETISIPVHQKARAEIARLKTDDSVKVGSDTTISFSVYNKGKSTLFNASIAFPKDSPFDGYEEYLGNIEAGKQNEADLVVPVTRAPKEGEELYFELVFEDELANETRIKQVFKINQFEEGEEGSASGMAGIGSEFSSPSGGAGSPSEGEVNPAEAGAYDSQSTGIRSQISQLPIWLKILVPVAAVAVIGGAAGMIRRRRRRKDLFDDEM